MTSGGFSVNDHFPFGPDFASRLEATYSLWGMLKLLDRCLAGQFSLSYTERVREGIHMMVLEIQENPVMEIDA
jgi:hypothetical protein